MSTLTVEVSGIKVKTMYLHCKLVKINDDFLRINEMKFNNPASPKAFSTYGERVYNVIDTITLFENYYSLCDEILKSQELGPLLPLDLSQYLKALRKKMSQWKHVRNKLGGHLNLGVIMELCEKNNYKGVFLSNHIIEDFKGVLLYKMLGEAVNNTLSKSKLFDSELELTKPQDFNLFIGVFMNDFRFTLELLNRIFSFLYDIGRAEKISVSTQLDIGLINFDK